MGDIITEIKSLMTRMENVEGGGSNFVDEDVDWRIQKGPNDFYDIIAGIGENKYVTMGYVRAVPELDLPNGQTLGNVIGIPGAKSLLKVTVYNFRWQKNNRVRNAYRFWRDNYLYFGKKYLKDFQGLKPPRYDTTNLNYGQDGITAYDDDNEKKYGNTYTPINYKHLKNEYTKSTFYVVLENGSIREVDPNKLTFKKREETSIERNIASLVSCCQDEEHEDVIKILQGMDYRLFLHSNILFISATSEGKPLVYINEVLSKELVEDTGVNQQELIQIAKDRYNKDSVAQIQSEE